MMRTTADTSATPEGPTVGQRRGPGPGRPPTTYTRVDRDYDTIRKDIRTLFHDLAIDAAA